MFDSYENAAGYVRWMLNDLHEKGQNVEVADVASCISLKYSKTITLEKESIEKNNEMVSSSERASLFIPLIKKSAFDKILVLNNDSGDHKFTVVAPLNTEISIGDAIRKVKFNGININGKDREAGLYDIESFKKLYWKTGTVEEN
jgi:hypothetical protein